jgi:phospholipase C
VAVRLIPCFLLLPAVVACGHDQDDQAAPADGGGDARSSRDGGPGAEAGAQSEAGVVDAAGDGSPDGSSCGVPLPDPHAAARAACTYAAGARVVDTLGVTAAMRAALPITHIVVVTQENRSFDHFYGKLAASGQPGAEGLPAGFANPDSAGVAVPAFHLASPCLPEDPAHQSAAMNEGWDHGAMDGFVKSAASSTSDGHFAMGYYDDTDLPFLYWLANTFSIADRYFAPVLGGTWGNRDFLYAGTSDGVTDTGSRTISVPTIFDALDAAHVGWGVYTDGNAPRQDCLGWTMFSPGVSTFSAFIDGLKASTLPAVSFVDPTGVQDEHPTNEIHGGEAWLRTIYETAAASTLWGRLAIVVTFDESGGLADHVPPPRACPPSPSLPTFDQLGMRVPTLVISPWAKAHYVSHVVHDHTSVLRLIEAVFDLPALTARDANADALLDMFDFGCPARTNLPAAPNAGVFVTCP